MRAARRMRITNTQKGNSVPQLTIITETREVVTIYEIYLPTHAHRCNGRTRALLPFDAPKSTPKPLKWEAGALWKRCWKSVRETASARLRICRICVPLGGFWMPFWTQLAPKGIPKAHFLAQNLEKLRKYIPKNDARKNMKFRRFFDAKMGSPDGWLQSSRSMLVPF